MIEIIEDDLYFHLTGGLRAKYNGESLLIWPVPKSGNIIINNVAQANLINALHMFGVRWIGLEKMVNTEELKHRFWFVFNYGNVKINHNNPHIATEVSQYWACISHAIRSSGGGDNELLSNIISYHLMSSAIRLRDISDYYGGKLLYASGRCMEPSHKFNTSDIYELFLAFHSFLGEMCSLRDYLAEYIAVYIFGYKKRTKIWKLSELREEINKIKTQHPLCDEIIRITDKDDKDGWMGHLSWYRNNIMHQAPIHYISGSEMLSVRRIVNGYGVDSIGIEYNIPLYQVKCSGHNEVEGDALEIFHGLMILMESFSARVGSYSGIAPKLIVIDQSDIMGEVEMVGTSI